MKAGTLQPMRVTLCSIFNSFVAFCVFRNAERQTGYSSVGFSVLQKRAPRPSRGPRPKPRRSQRRGTQQ